jgi:dTDP-4-amino-4,6-dideoxygalactose transaminase
MTSVPFFRPDIGEREVEEVVATLRSGWLTTGPKVRLFETAFGEAVHAPHRLAVNSCTAALHLAVEALGLRPGQAVLVPTMTFAATAEIIRYAGAVPVLVDCDPTDMNIDLTDAARKVEQLELRRPPGNLPRGLPVAGIIPVHVAGMMMDIDAVQRFASRHGIWRVEDAAHAFPAAWRRSRVSAWQQCGEGTATITCFSFYANKTITTGEGGMVVTNHPRLAERMRLMALHGLSADAWERYSGKGSWDYRIVAPGYKYNLTDIAASIGIHQLARAEQMRARREQIARTYRDAFADIDEIELPREDGDRLHAWHLFPIKLRLDKLAIDRDEFVRELTQAGIGCSVHWRPLHLHPYYEQTFGWHPREFPVATSVWTRLVSLPIFSAMHQAEVAAVILAVKQLCARHRPVQIVAAMGGIEHSTVPVSPALTGGVPAS